MLRVHSGRRQPDIQGRLIPHDEEILLTFRPVSTVALSFHIKAEYHAGKDQAQLHNGQTVEF